MGGEHLRWVADIGGENPQQLGLVVELWINPWAEHPFAEAWPFSLDTARESGEVVSEEKDPALAALFDLPEPWPEGRPCRGIDLGRSWLLAIARGRASSRPTRAVVGGSEAPRRARPQPEPKLGAGSRCGSVGEGLWMSGRTIAR